MNENMMRKLRMTCEDTSQLISERMDHDLPLADRIRVAIHLAICEFCRYYKNQLETLRALARGLGGEETPAFGETRLSARAREKIQKRLDSEI